MQRASALVLTLFFVAACEDKTPPPAPPPPPPPPPAAAPAAAPAPPPSGPVIDPLRLSAFQPLPKEAVSDTNPITDAKVELGHRLFFETRISSSGKTSCESCHALANFGVDGLPFAKGQNGKSLRRNTLTVFNAALSGSFGWDGHSDSLEGFIAAHVADPSVMGTTDAKLKSAGYEKDVAAMNPSSPEPNVVNASMAIGAYLRRLMTPSPWDKFLAGDKAALTDDQKKGFNTFADSGCMTCHGGVNLGGQLIQKLGIVKPWPAPKNPADADLGRYEATKNDDDKGLFRSAPLRNISKTAPYSVDGSIASVEEMSKLMGAHQLGLTLTDAQTASIATFLTALTGELPATLIAKPTSEKK